MPTPFNFNLNLNPRVKLVVIVLAIFLVSVSVGMLVFGNSPVTSDGLNAEVLQHGAEAIHLTP